MDTQIKQDGLKVVLATRNAGKIKELNALLAGLGVTVVGLGEFPEIGEIPETGTTFLENARLKAWAVAKATGLVSLADDSGLCVDALSGAPGVYSARYAGPGATDWDNCEKLLGEMAGKTDRAAHFVCVLSLATPAGPALTWEGRCDGEITTERRGESGFGYDPVFFFPEFARTFAEVTMAEKSVVSHRGRALAEFAAEFPKVQVWLRQRMAEIKPPKPDHSEFEHNDWSKEKM